MVGHVDFKLLLIHGRVIKFDNSTILVLLLTYYIVYKVFPLIFFNTIIPSHVYGIAFKKFFPLLFFSPVIPSHVSGIISLAIFMVTLYVQGRQTEWTSRLDFLWKTQVR